MVNAVTHISVVGLENTTTKEVLNVKELVPNNLLESTSLFITFMEKYYEYLNSEYPLASNVISNLFQQKNVDTANDESLAKIKYALMRYLPQESELDEKTVIKNIIEFYKQKGSQESIVNFFKIFFGDSTATVYYPWEDVLICSNGEWQGGDEVISIDGSETILAGFVLAEGMFKSNKGFLSDSIYLQDSYYYQRYSYDINIGLPRSLWEGVFNRSIHPAGFKKFVSIFILVYILSNISSEMPLSQYGIVEDTDNIIIMYQQLSIELDSVLTQMFPLFVESVEFINEWSTRFLFFDPSYIEPIDSYTLEEIDENIINITLGAIITTL